VRIITALLVLGCIVSVSPGQYVETTILLPDSTSGLTGVRSLVYHSPTSTIYVGGDDSFLICVNAQTNAKLRRVSVGRGPHVLCSVPPGNRVYCANQGATVTVIDGATNLPVKTISVQRRVTDLIYDEHEGKLYCGNATDSFVRVIDCVGDSVVGQVPVSFGPTALCYNPQLNRIYCAHETEDEVTVIDCAADTVLSTVWVRGVEPHDICYDSGSQSVFTANTVSNTVSVIDCEGDTVSMLLHVGREPGHVVAGPPGKVYCSNYRDSSVSVISDSGVKTVRTGPYPIALSFDPVNNKIYCPNRYSSSVTVIDVVQDTAIAQVRTGSYPMALCRNSAGNNTYVACHNDDVVEVIDDVSDTVEAVITFFVCSPGPLCYNTTNNHLYCLDNTQGVLLVIDGDSNRVLKTLKVSTSGGSDTLIWNPVSNKVYFTNSHDSTVSILDCLSDSIVATVGTGKSPQALCCGDDGKVYVANHEGRSMAVVDGSGDSVLAVVPVGDYPGSLSYDRNDSKVYVGRHHGNGDTVVVIDICGDSVVARIPVPPIDYATVCWNQNHNKVYVGDPDCDSVAVVDCAGDTVLRKVHIPFGTWGLHSDSVCDKVYGVESWPGGLQIIRASTDTFCQSLSAGYLSALLDNGKQGPANRLYCASPNAGEVAVVAGYKTDSILRRITVEDDPAALAWNPTYSRVYVSNHGSSSISVIRDTIGVGVEEGQPLAPSHKPQATVVRGVLNLGVDSRQQTGYRAELLDAAGRRVMSLKAGANDVRALAPGVYFVRQQGSRGQGFEDSRVAKVVVTR